MPRNQRAFIDIEGLDEVVKMFDKCEKQALAGLDNAARKAVVPVYKTAKEDVRKRTGKTMRNIKIRKEKSKKSGKAVYQVYFKWKKRNEKDVSRAGIFLEFGTKYTKAQPYLRPAVVKNKKNVQAIFQAEIAKVVKG